MQKIKLEEPEFTEFHEIDPVEKRNALVEDLKDSPIYGQAKRQAEKFMRKNRREWKRLHERAETALLSGDKDSYAYAIKKMRDMLKQPYNDHLIDSMWISSRKTLEDIFLKANKAA